MNVSCVLNFIYNCWIAIIFSLGCDDVLVVVGGFGSQQSPIDTVEQFDPKKQLWTQLPVIAVIQY